MFVLAWLLDHLIGPGWRLSEEAYADLLENIDRVAEEMGLGPDLV